MKELTEHTQAVAAAASAAATVAAVNAARTEVAASVSLLGQDIAYIKTDVGEVKTSLKEFNSHYVTKTEFQPVQKLVYGLVAVIMIAVVVALISLVVK